jgi:hypothetical protein
MGRMQTNRNLYVAIAALIGQHRTYPRTLEEYLRALGHAAASYRKRPSLSVPEFCGLLARGFTDAIPPFDEGWRSRYAEDFAKIPGFHGWEARWHRQVVDLHEMGEQGMLANELRYFGIRSPRGQLWYNFDPCTFLECATAGSYGGWQPGDDTGREYVPGPVAALGEDGRFKAMDPREVPAPVVSIPQVSWREFRSFLGAGQWYE